MPEERKPQLHHSGSLPSRVKDRVLRILDFGVRKYLYGLCDLLINRPEESYWLWCVVVCDLENFKNEEAMTRVGSQRHRKKKA